MSLLRIHDTETIYRWERDMNSGYCSSEESRDRSRMQSEGNKSVEIMRGNLLLTYQATRIADACSTYENVHLCYLDTSQLLPLIKPTRMARV